ncbi:PTS system IId component [Salmonella enterica subsp. enterica]|uniref:PTS system IId component n=1 Tax=Salmonella enterica I TaxID=59201 RepID=A0A3S4HWI8_SALET|nr:PTS system IId component [Salmonella enterica subsp. enterica]
MFNVPHILARWFFTRWGYVLGTGVLQRIQQSGMMEKPNLWRLDYRSDGGWRDDGLHD